MADNQKPFSLEQLKTDPDLWKRLATPMEGSEKMGNVFLEKENPFIAAAAAAAMEKARKLAEEGKLYVREFGRSRHFQKVEKEGEGFKLGEQVDAKTAGPYDPALGMLHRLSQRYFRRFGMEKIANWFGKRVEKYDAYLALDKHYKSEYDSMSKEQKEQLKALRKQEKKEKALKEKEEELRKELDKVQKELDGLKKDKMPKGEQEKASQPGQQPAQDQAQKEQPQLEQEQPQPEQQQPQAGRKPGAIYIDGIEFTGDVKDADPEVLHALAQKIRAQMEQAGQQQPEAQQPGGQGQQDPQQQVPGGPVTQPPQPGQPPQPDQQPGDPVPQTGPAVPRQGENDGFQPFEDEPQQGGPAARDDGQIVRDGDAIYVDGVKITGDVKDLDPKLLQDLVAQIKTQVKAQPRQEEPEILGQPLNHPMGAVENDVSQLIDDDAEPERQAEPQENIDLLIFDEPERQAEPQENIDLLMFDDEPEQPVPATLQARLARERERLENVTAWSNGLIEAMLNNDTNREYYERVTDPTDFTAEESRTMLMGAVSAMFGTEEGRQQGEQLLEYVMSGQPGREPAFESQVQQGLQAFERALASMVRENNDQPLNKLMSDSVRELSRAASAQTELSERNILIGRLISETFRMAQEQGIQMDLNAEELAAAKGALTMSAVAEKNLQARQLLGGKGDLNLRDPQTVTAIRDILMAKGVESYLRADAPQRGAVAPTQLLMGTDVLSLKNLELMTNSSGTRQRITTKQVEELLNSPQGTRAKKAGMQVAKKFAKDALQQAEQAVNVPHNELEQQLQNPIFN